MCVCLCVNSYTYRYHWFKTTHSKQEKTPIVPLVLHFSLVNYVLYHTNINQFTPTYTKFGDKISSDSELQFLRLLGVFLPKTKSR